MRPHGLNARLIPFLHKPRQTAWQASQEAAPKTTQADDPLEKGSGAKQHIDEAELPNVNQSGTSPRNLDFSLGV